MSVHMTLVVAHTCSSVNGLAFCILVKLKRNMFGELHHRLGSVQEPIDPHYSSHIDAYTLHRTLEWYTMVD
jgi:hypothetical protein